MVVDQVRCDDLSTTKSLSSMGTPVNLRDSTGPMVAGYASCWV